MENAKNTFYVTLRDRLAVLNPARTMMVRGVTRPGILVAENELTGAQTPMDVFVIGVPGLKVLQQMPSAVVQMSVEIQYGTAGTSGHGGMDRGKMLVAMDAELNAMLQPATTPKYDYSTAPAIAMSTVLFWSDPVYGAVIEESGRLMRRVTVEMFSVQEPGER